MGDRAHLEEQLRLLRRSYSTADFGTYDDEDEDEDGAAQIPQKTIASVIKKMNTKLREGIQTTMGRQAQRAVLEQLAAAGTVDMSTQLELAGLEGRLGSGAAVGLSRFPEEWVGADGKPVGGKAGAAYSELRAEVIALERSLAATKTRLQKLEGLRVPGWSNAGALAMHQGVSVQSEVNRAELLLGLLRNLQAKKR